jgi:hypothetical protein
MDTYDFLDFGTSNAILVSYAPLRAFAQPRPDHKSLEIGGRQRRQSATTPNTVICVGAASRPLEIALRILHLTFLFFPSKRLTDLTS